MSGPVVGPGNKYKVEKDMGPISKKLMRRRKKPKENEKEASTVLNRLFSYSEI